MTEEERGHEARTSELFRTGRLHADAIADIFDHGSSVSIVDGLFTSDGRIIALDPAGPGETELRIVERCPRCLG